MGLCGATSPSVIAIAASSIVPSVWIQGMKIALSLGMLKRGRFGARPDDTSALLEPFDELPVLVTESFGNR